MNVIIRSRVIIVFFLTAVVTLSYIGLLRFRSEKFVRTNGSKKMLQKTEKEQHRRQKHINRICHLLRFNNSTASIPSSYLDHFIVDEEHKLIYCYVPKVACTNWKRILLVLRSSNSQDPLAISGNKTHLPNVFQTLNQFPSDQVQEKLNTYLKFMFVRHPYERLLSAYRNKLEKSYGDYFRIRFGTQIIKNYRNNPTKESLEKGHDVNFEEFLHYVTDLQTENNKILFNEHWRPIFDLCFPCQVNYDIIGKYDTLENDAEYTLWKAGVSDFITFPKREQSYKQQPTADIMHSYYKNISNSLQQKLLEIYKEDFILFEYEPFHY